MRTIEYIGGMVEIDEYQEQHRLKNQTLHEGFPLNPTLRDSFDSTPNELREDAEMNDWWGLPYIISYTWEGQKEYNQKHLENIKEHNPELLEKVIKDLSGAKERWFERHPSGVTYQIRCLDGGAWDRSTHWGQTDNLEVAVQIAKNGPAWRKY